MKKWAVLLILLAMVAGGCGKRYKEDGMYAEISTDKGLIKIKLFYQKAPLTVANFVGLAEGTIKNSIKQEGQPYFDGLNFHRVVPDFVIQGGDPAGNGTGGPGYSFPNEIHADLKHDSEGIVAMANAGPHTNGSQFYITLKEVSRLDGGYSVFGKVVEGMEVVKAITVGDKIKEVKIYRQGKDAKAFKADDETFRTMITKAQDEITRQKREKKEKNIALIEEKWPNAITTDTGLKYMILREGKGEPPKKGTKIKAHYTGMLLDGKKFDSSVDRGTPFEFEVGVGRVIPGWDEAFLAMKKGEKRILIIPPELGYGARGAGNVIPPNAYLVFEVEMIDF